MGADVVDSIVKFGFIEFDAFFGLKEGKEAFAEIVCVVNEVLQLELIELDAVGGLGKQIRVGGTDLNANRIDVLDKLLYFGLCNVIGNLFEGPKRIFFLRHE